MKNNSSKQERKERKEERTKALIFAKDIFALSLSQ